MRVKRAEENYATHYNPDTLLYIGKPVCSLNCPAQNVTPP